MGHYILTQTVTCFGYEGIDAVKEALRRAEAKNTPENQVKVKLVSPPLYGMLGVVYYNLCSN
jgi:translation initiation factor 2 alpha subunit (eIF-2alpha)